MPGLTVGVLALVAVLVAGIALLIRGGTAHSLPVALPSAFLFILEAAKIVGAGRIALGLLLSFALVKLSVGLTRGRV